MALADHAPGFKAQPSAEGQYAFGAEERSQDDFCALREGLPEIAVGDELVTEGGTFRVVAVGDTPNNLLIRYTVEVSHA